MNDLIENAKTSRFPLPFFLLPLVAFGLYLTCDIAGGTLADTLCRQFHLTSAAANRVLLLSVGLNVLPILLWVKFVEQRDVRGLGLVRQSSAKHSAIGAACGLAAFALIVGIGFVLRVVRFQAVDFSASNVISVLFMLPFWVVQSGAEEILTRGWVLPAVSARSNRLLGVLLSSALFVVLHLNNAGLNALAVLNILLVGVLLALYTLKSNSLWGAVLFHALWNFTQGSFFGLSVSGGAAAKPSLMQFASQGSVLLGGGRFGLEAGVITTAVLLLFLSALLLSCKAPLLLLKREKQPRASIDNASSQNNFI